MKSEKVGEDQAFGNAVRDYLHDQHHTQVWLAGEIGMDPTTLSKALNADRRLRKSAVLAIGSVLQLPPDEQERLLGMLNYSSTEGVDLNLISTQGRKQKASMVPTTEELLDTIQRLERKVDRLTFLVEERMNFQITINSSPRQS